MNEKKSTKRINKKNLFNLIQIKFFRVIMEDRDGDLGSAHHSSSLTDTFPHTGRPCYLWTVFQCLLKLCSAASLRYVSGA